MIYSRQIRLEGQEADNFLEASGITICDDEIIIEDAVVEFDAAIEHLAENGISLYEDCIILEGKQAEEYKARKAKERQEDAKKYDYKHRRLFKISQGEDYDKAHTMYQTDADKRYDKFHKSVDAFIDNKDPSKHNKLHKQAEMDRSNYFNHSSTSIPDIMRHNRRQSKKYRDKSKNESTIFDSVELTGIDEQVFFRYKKDSQGLLHAEAKKLAGIVNGIDLSDDSHLSKYGIHIDKIEYVDDSFILRRKFNVKIHFGYDYKIKSEDIDYEVVEKLMDAILAKAGYRKYGRYSVKKGNGYLFAIDYQDIYIEESDQYYTVNYGTGDMPMTSGMTSRAHTPEQRYIDIDIKCIEDTPGNMSLLRK